MANFLSTTGTTSEIEKIINNAKNGLVLISPFVKFSDRLFQNLRAADERGIKITLVYGKNKTLEPDTKDKLAQLKNLKLRFLENLHAKCYFNEQSMVITSLNLLDFSEQKNREMGVLITQQNDEEAFTGAIKEAKMIIYWSTQPDFNMNFGASTKQIRSDTNNIEIQKPVNSWFKRLSDILPGLFGDDTGYCIGCNKQIEYDEFRPYCLDCYKTRGKDKSLKANYCHQCGHKSSTTFNKPLCHSCFERS